MSLAFQRLASLQGHHPNSYSSTADLMVGSNSPFLSPPMSSPAMVNMTNQMMTSETLLQLSMLNSSPFLSSYSHSPLLNTSPYYTQTQHYPVMPFNFSNSGSSSLLPSHSSLLPPSYMNLPSHHAPDLSFASAPHFLSFASKPLDSKENPLASAALVLSSYNKDDNLSVTTHASETDRDSTAPETERRPKTTKSSTLKDKSPKPGECRNRCVIFCGRSEPGASPDEQPVFQAEALCKPLGQCLTLYTTEPEGKSQQKLNLFAAGDVARVLACSSHMLAMYLRRRRTQVDSGIYQATKVSHRREAFKGARSNAYFLTEEACASFKQHCEQRRTRESEKGK